MAFPKSEFAPRNDPRQLAMDQALFLRQSEPIQSLPAPPSPMHSRDKVVKVTAVRRRDHLPLVESMESGATPLVDAITEHRSRGIASFSTPGHRRGAGASHELRSLLGDDLFASDIWLNTGHFERTLRTAETLAAETWGGDRAYFLTNGSTSANHAALLALVRPGAEVIVSRDVHKSIIVGMVLSGVMPIYVTPRIHPTLGMSLGPDPQAVAQALAAHPQAKLVILVSPTYWGVAADISAIVEIAHQRDVPVFVDEAWGPHLPFHPALPAPALASGADCAVTSVHKLLGCLSQASLLLTRGKRIDEGRFETAVRMVRSTSPSLPMLASIDACRQQMATNGRSMLDSLLDLAQDTRVRLDAIPGIEIVTADSPRATGRSRRSNPVGHRRQWTWVDWG